MVDIKIPTQFIKSIMNIDGGQNDKWDALSIGDDQWAELIDFIYDDAGNITMREGCDPLTTASGSYGLAALGRWKRNDTGGEQVLSVDTNGSLYRKVGTGQVELIAGMTANKVYQIVGYVSTTPEDRAYIITSGSAIKVIESDYSERAIGCPAPGTKPTVALGGGTGLTGAYYYRFAWIYPWGVSSVSPISDVINPSNQKVTVSTALSYPAGATGIRFYRSAAGALTYLHLTDVTSPTASYSDYIGDGVLGVTGHTTYDVPGVTSHMFIWKDYAYFLREGEAEVRHSILGKPDIVEPSSHYEPIQDANNRPVAINATNNPDFMVWFYEKSIVAWSGTSPYQTDTDKIVMGEIDHTLGCPAANSIQNVGGNLVFLGSDKRIHMLTTISLSATETVKPETLSEPIDGLMQSGLNESMLSKASAIYWDRKYMLFFASTYSTYLDKVVIIDFNLEKKPWVQAVPIGALSCGIYSDANGNDKPIIGGHSSPNIYQFLSGYTDAGVAITPTATSKKYHMGQVFNRKIFEHFRLFGEATPEYSFTVRFYVIKNGKVKTKDAIFSGSAASASLTPSVAWAGNRAWGVGCWTNDVSWSAAITEFKIKSRLAMDGEIIWFKIMDVNSTYRLKFKGYEFRGFIMRAE